MVAVRGSHLSNPHDFEIEQWCSSLKLAAPVEKSLIDAWYYAQAKILSISTPDCNPHIAIWCGNGGDSA